MTINELTKHGIYKGNPPTIMDEKDILVDNWNRINKLMDKRTDQLQKLYGSDWYKESLKDNWYQFLLKNILQLKEWAKRITNDE